MESETKNTENAKLQSELSTRALGLLMTSGYSGYINRDKTIGTRTASIPIDETILHDVRGGFYLEIVDLPDARARLLEQMKFVIQGLESSKELKLYTPSPDSPVYVFRAGKKIAQLTDSISTFGTFGWNSVIGNRELGVSRIHAIIVLMKNAEGGVFMFVIDGWSLGGTSVLDQQGCATIGSVSTGRNVLLCDMKSCAMMKFSNDVVTFSSASAKECIICLDQIREVRLPCGHGVLCKTCVGHVSQCPICRTSIDRRKIHDSMCLKTFSTAQ